METGTAKSLRITYQTILLTMGLYFISRIVRNNGYYVLIAPLESSSPVLYEGLFYLGHLIVLAFIALYFLLHKEERFCLKSAVWNRKSILLVLLGLLAGFVMNGGSILSAVLHGDMDMVLQRFDPAGLIFIFVCVAVQSSTEEVQFRLWAHNRIASEAPAAYAVIGSGLAFGMLHLLNTGITFTAFLNICLIGILYSLSVYYFNSIWFCCAHHAAWNFTQNCVFGLPNSGTQAVITIAAPTYTDSSFFYDPVFGVEGTLFTTLIVTAAIVVFLILIASRKKRAV